jgi:hypothetical protein
MYLIVLVEVPSMPRGDHNLMMTLTQHLIDFDYLLGTAEEVPPWVVGGMLQVAHHFPHRA